MYMPAKETAINTENNFTFTLNYLLALVRATSGRISPKNTIQT